jgi:hypothetical protein
MNPSIPGLLASVMLCLAGAATAADTSPGSAGPAASGAGPKPAAAKPAPPPAAGGNGGNVATNGSNTATQVGPKKPKCPDPGNVACPKVQTPAK